MATVSTSLPPSLTNLPATSAAAAKHGLPRNPLIIIIGATGTGKSNLALEIASHLSRSQSLSSPTSSNPGHEQETEPAITKHASDLKAEIINADAMQLYTGLPIITNKLSAAEQNSVPHHLLNHIELHEQPWTVNKFVKKADEVIADMRKRGKTPIVVGGTGYYVHGLMLEGAILEDDEQKRVQNGGDSTVGRSTDNGDGESDDDIRSKFSIFNAPTPEVYARLQEVDPVMANRWHPNDRRKISRSLEIFLKTGRKASDVYAEQQQNKSRTAAIVAKTEGESNGEINRDDLEREENMSETLSEQTDTASSRLRYDPLIFWLDAEDAILKDRLDSRVNTMLKNGLLEEAKEMAAFEQTMIARGEEDRIDKSKGIWVSIGYKEMEPWLEQLASSSTQQLTTTTIDRDEQETKSLQNIQNACIESVKAGTRRYAKRQNRYIRIRLADDLAKVGVSDKLFLLDCSDLERWREKVVRPAVDIVDAFLRGDDLPRPEDMSELAKKTFRSMDKPEKTEEARIARPCEICDKVLMTENEWNKHVNGRPHKKIMQGIRKRAARESREHQIAVHTENHDPT